MPSRCFSALLLSTAIVFAVNSAAVRSADPLVFISNFAPGEAGGIQAATLDLKTGSLKPGHRTAGVDNAFFLALSRDRRFLYSIYAKQFGSPAAEEVAAFELRGRTGELKPLNRQSTRGSASCYLDVDATGRTLLVANYTTGDIAALPVKPDGSLGEAATFIRHTGSSVNPERQKGPNAHCLVISPDNKFAFAADLGIDKILCYRLDAAAAKLTPNRQPWVRTPPGAGPRHLTFHPNGKNVYVINELANSVTVFDYLPDSGMLIEQQTISTLPEEYDGTSHCADVKVTPNGKFLYGTNRGHDSIAVYRIEEGGRLMLVEIRASLGKGPQNLAVAPGGELLLCANMAGNNVAVFRIDQQMGTLTAVGAPSDMTGPSCIMIVP
jgi:6-phosphogluconolactonase